MNKERTNLPSVVENDAPIPFLSTLEDQVAPAGMSLTQVICILRAHWQGSVFLLLTLIVVSGLVIKLLPKSYVATATLIVNRGDRDPLATSDFPPRGQNTFIPTQIELIRSAVVLQPVIDRLHLMQDPEFTRGFSGPPSALREAVLTHLHKALKVTQGTGSDLVYVAAASKSPVEAAAIANAVAGEYLTLNRRRIDGPAIRRARLYSQELADLRAKTIRAQNRVTSFRARHGMIDLAPGNNDEAETALRDLEKRLLAAQNTERILQSEMQAGSFGATGAGAAGLDAKTLATEESELAKLRTSLGPRHPAVLELRSQIATTRRIMASGLSAQLADARSLVQKYQVAVSAQRRTVLRRRKIQDEGSKLLLELQSVQSTYKRALDGYPQIEFASSGNFNDVSLISHAAAPVVAAKPPKLKYFLMGCVLSLFLALGLPFAYELVINRRLRCRDDLERHFGIPVLAQFEPPRQHHLR